MNTSPKTTKSRKGLTTGLILIFLGVIWLLRKMDVGLPYWIFDWEMILIYIGIFVGISKGFDEPAPWVLMGLGGFFLIEELDIIPFELREFFWPVLIIVIGLVIIFRRRKTASLAENYEKYDDYRAEYENKDIHRSRKIDSVSIFNGTKKNIFSKNFLGGETVTVFGGTEINLLQADFEHPIEIEAVVVFGGLKLIVPRHWEVRTNVTSVLSGVQDKRVSAIEIVNDEKVLHLTGVVIFGGIDIVTY